jgi:hypothetical protein
MGDGFESIEGRVRLEGREIGLREIEGGKLGHRVGFRIVDAADQYANVAHRGGSLISMGQPYDHKNGRVGIKLLGANLSQDLFVLGQLAGTYRAMQAANLGSANKGCVLFPVLSTSRLTYFVSIRSTKV